MAVPGNPIRATAAYSEGDPLDDEWERFQANGCPDWWLLAKYVGQAAARSFPYQPFRGMSSAGGTGASSPSTPVAASSGLAATSMSSAGRRRAASCDGCLIKTGKHTAAAEGAVEMQQQQHHSACPQETDKGGIQPPAGQQAPQQLAPAGACDSPTHATGAAGGVPDALPTSSHRSSGGSQAAAAPVACGLKGLFGGCAGGCTPPCTAAQAAPDQRG